MQNAETTNTARVVRAQHERYRAVIIGDEVRLVAGQLAGLEGTVVRCEPNNSYLVGIPDANSGVLIRVHRQRFECLE